MKNASKCVWAILVCLVCLITPSGSVHAAPGDILFSDNFDDGAGCSALAPWTAAGAGDAGTNTDTSASGNCSAFTRWGVVTVTSPVVALNGITGANLTAWVRKGADTFSEDPDGVDDLVLEFQNSAGAWIVLETFTAGGIPDGGIVNVNRNLPAQALHPNFQLRFRQTAGSGPDFDYWHFDDVVITETGIAPPPALTANSCDFFENGLQNFVASDPIRVGTSSQTSNSPTNSLFLRHGVASATSVAINTSALTNISVWVRKGADAFSENPEAGENLVIEALDNLGNWIALETFAGGGTQGQIFTRNYTPTAALQHPNFQIRFRITGGSGSDFDYWHVDDLCFTSVPPDIDVQKTSQIVSDPINGTTNPKAIPGAIVRYTITITNTGAGTVDAGSVVVSDTLAAETAFFAGDLGGGGLPFIFTDGTGTNSTGLSVNFGGLGDASDGITFLDASNSSITPTAGFDSNVAGFVIDMDGPVNGTSGGGTPVFTIQFDVRVE